jgi:hypothetical protein
VVEGIEGLADLLLTENKRGRSPLDIVFVNFLSFS